MYLCALIQVLDAMAWQRLLISVILVLCIIAGGTFAVFHWYNSTILPAADISDEMRERADAVRILIVEQTNKIDTDMQRTASSLAGITDDATIMDTLYDLYWKYPDGPGVYLMDASGGVVAAVPYAGMNDILNNPEFLAITEKSFSNGTGIRLEGPLYTAAYGEVLCFLLPVYTNDDVYNGYICLGQSTDILRDRFSFPSENSSTRYDVWIASPDGTVMWHPNSDLIGKNIKTSHLFDEFKEEMYPILEDPQGEGIYHYMALGRDEAIIEKKAVWRTVDVGEKSYRVVLINYEYVCPAVVFPENMTDTYLQDITRSLYIYAQSHTKEQTFAKINDPAGPFAKKGVLTFAYNMDGTLLAHSVFHHLIGEKRLNYKEAYGVTNTISGMINRASQGGGFVNHFTAIPYSDHKATLDLSYVLPVDDTWFVGASMPVNETLFTYNHNARNILYKNLENARKYLHKYGKEKTLEEFMNPSGSFLANNISVFAVDFDGTLLAGSDIFPSTIGENTFSTVSYHGGSIAREFVILAKSGGGFTYYEREAADGNGTELYLMYVEPVDDTWYMGTGIPIEGSYRLL